MHAYFSMVWIHAGSFMDVMVLDLRVHNHTDHRGEMKTHLLDWLQRIA